MGECGFSVSADKTDSWFQSVGYLFEKACNPVFKGCFKGYSGNNRLFFPDVKHCSHEYTLYFFQVFFPDFLKKDINACLGSF